MAHHSRWRFRVDVTRRKLGPFQDRLAALMGRRLTFEADSEDGLLIATVDHEGASPAESFHEVQAMCLTLSPHWTIAFGDAATRAESRRPDVRLPGLVEVLVIYGPLPREAISSGNGVGG